MSSIIEKLQRAIWANSIFDNDLPIGIYAISKDGSLITCNQRVRRTLNLIEGDLDHSIQDFFSNPELTKQLNQILIRAEKENRWIEKQALPLKVGDRELFVHHYLRAIKDDLTGETDAYLCCMVDFTEEEHYRQIFESLPVGAYQVDKDDILVEANQAFARMLGYESASQVENRSVKGLYLHPEDASKFRQMVESQNAIVSQRVELLKKDSGAIIVASVIARKLRSPDGKYIGREGAMIDVTNEERYRKLLEEMPLGLYEVRINEQGEDVINHCNHQFAAINEFDDVKDLIGFKVKDFYSSPEDYKNVIKAINEKAKDDKPLHGLWVPARGQKGKKMVVEVNTRVLRDRSGQMIGRIGAVREVTEEAELKANEEKLSKKVHELTFDIGNVLHSYSTALINVRQSTHVVLQSLGRDPFEQIKGVLPEQMVDTLASPAKQLAKSLSKFTQEIESQGRADALPEVQKSELAKNIHMLNDYEKIIPYPMARFSTLRESAIAVLALCGEIQKGKFAKELFRQIRMDAQELLRICNLITLHQMSDMTLEIDHVVNQLRGYLLSGLRNKDPKVVCLVRDLVSQTAMGLHEFARSRGIDFKIRYDEPDCQIEAVPSDVIRALSNLLHNAIKYSWKRPGGVLSWISIRTRLAQGVVCIEFENYGVPIPKDEKDLIFLIRFRGRKSSDRRRAGTGIGLTDARQVAKEHNGDVSIDSHPASPGGSPDNYDQPFLTTVTFRIPAQIG
ncbi:MAG: PAS domain S-box protein [Blastocatellia bacterium]